MPVLRLNDQSDLAQLFNNILRHPALGFAADAGNRFGAQSAEGAKKLQQKIKDRLIQGGMAATASGIQVDGMPGNQTWGFLCAYDAPDLLKPQDIAQAEGVAYPVRPAHLPPPPTNAQMAALFGDIQAVPAPTTGNPERIRIVNGWDQQNIVTVPIPQTAGLAGSTLSGRHAMHRQVQAQMKGLWQAWQNRGLLSRITTFSGLWVPRFQRGSKTKLSNHAWGTAFDINASSNAYWHLPAFPGENGCLFDLVPIAADFGFGWGGHYSQRLDGMHFEVVQVLSDAEVAQALLKHPAV